MRPRGKVAITDEMAHSYVRVREEHADVRLGLEGFGYEALDVQ